MKHFQLLIALLFLFGTKGLCQTPTDADTLTPQRNAEEITNNMTCELGLSNSEIIKIKSVTLDACRKMDQEMKSTTDKKRLNTAEDAIEKVWFGQIKEILDHKQWVLFEKISNGDEKSLKLTRVCRPQSQDAYGGF